MISIGNFFFKYRNLLFPIFALSIFIPSRPLFTAEVFGPGYFNIPLIAGLVIAITGQVIRAITVGLKYIKRGGKDKKVYAEDLVTGGMFSHCRNPLYVGNILMLAGAGLISNSMLFMLVLVPLFCFIYQAIVMAEENFLRGKFGPGYDAYAADVNRWLPNLRGIGNTITGMEFNWRRYVINEYNTVYLLLVSILIIIMTHHPGITPLPLNEKLQYAGIIFLALSLVYLFVRYLKKSRKHVAV